MDEKLSPPTLGELIQFMRKHKITRRKLSEIVHVSISTVDQWLASDQAVERSRCRMPAGLFELAQLKMCKNTS